MITPITRNEARARGLARFFTGRPCIHQHLAERLVSSGQCIVCHRAKVHRAQRRGGARYERNRERENRARREQRKRWALLAQQRRVLQEQLRQVTRQLEAAE
jgi:hypothetical protein